MVDEFDDELAEDELDSDELDDELDSLPIPGLLPRPEKGGSVESEAAYVCDSCGEEIVIPVDRTAGSRQEYVEDCPVCCHPIVIRVEIDDAGRTRIDSEHE